MNKSIETALKTWYPKNHALHFDPIHPAMGLAGEIGEWINLHKKDEFKSGYELSKENEIDELGDIWYYLRILMYQFNFETYMTMYSPPATTLHHAMGELAQSSGEILSRVFPNSFNAHIVKYNIGNIFEHLDCYINGNLGMSLTELTEINWEKLKPGSTRGDEWVKSW